MELFSLLWLFLWSNSLVCLEEEFDLWNYFVCPGHSCLSNSVNVLDNVQSLTLSYDLRTQYVLRLTYYYYVVKQMMREK